MHLNKFAQQEELYMKGRLKEKKSCYINAKVVNFICLSKSLFILPLYVYKLII